MAEQLLGKAGTERLEGLGQICDLAAFELLAARLRFLGLEDPADLADVFNAGTGTKGPDEFKPRADMRKWLAGHKGHPLTASVKQHCPRSQRR